MDTTMLRRYIELRTEQAGHEESAKQAKEEANHLEQQLLEMYAAESVQRLTLDGRTVYLRRDLLVSQAGGQREALHQALRDIGEGHLVGETVHPSTLKGWVRDLDAEGVPLPAELDGLVNVTEAYRLKIRRAG